MRGYVNVVTLHKELDVGEIMFEKKVTRPIAQQTFFDALVELFCCDIRSRLVCDSRVIKSLYTEHWKIVRDITGTVNFSVVFPALFR